MIITDRTVDEIRAELRALRFQEQQTRSKTHYSEQGRRDEIGELRRKAVEKVQGRLGPALSELAATQRNRRNSLPQFEDGAVERIVLGYRKAGIKGTLPLEHLNALSNDELREIVAAVAADGTGTVATADIITADDCRAILRRRAEQGDQGAEPLAPVVRQHVKRLLIASKDMQRTLYEYENDLRREEGIKYAVEAMSTGDEDDGARRDAILAYRNAIAAGTPEAEARAAMDQRHAEIRDAAPINLQPTTGTGWR